MDDVFGQLTVRRNKDGSVSAEWFGPKYLKISQELMHQADQDVFKREGDLLTICQYHLKIIGRDELGDYIAERIDFFEGA